MDTKENHIKLVIRCSIPSTSQQNNFVSKLSEYGFYKNEIQPDKPKGKEFMAYKVIGFFKGTWLEFFAACEKVSVEWQIMEFIAKLSDDE